MKVERECRSSKSAEEGGGSDTYLLLSHFPSGLLEKELPVRTGPGVYLESVPRALLAAADPPACADYALPGYNVDRDQFRYCLRSPGAEAAATGYESTVLFFNALAALRLRSPFHIEVEGWIRVRGSGRPEWGRTYHTRSPWKPEAIGFYLLDDLSGAEEIAERQIELWGLENQRMLSACLFFLQVTCGFSVSFQMAYLGLFAALDALFTPAKPNAKNLGERTAKFLSNIATPGGWEIEQWVHSEYKDVRNKIAHGVQDVDPSGERLSLENRQRFGRLHEIVRLCVLGFMGLSDSELEAIGKAKKKRQLEPLLDGLAPATGGFVSGQRMWCD